MLLLGIDIGTSAVKVSVVDAATQQCIASASFPEKEAGIISLQSGWAEQSPGDWWRDTCHAIQKVNASGKYDAKDIAAIGIAYQMHGLVVTGKDGKPLRNSIIWCDSRAIDYGERAFNTIGAAKCLSNLLNSPGNFTAAKLAWVKEHEPEVFDNTDKMMLPGDFIALQLTGSVTTSASSLSEGILWDFATQHISKDVTGYFGFDESLIPPVQDVFSTHGLVTAEVAAQLGLKAGIPVAYKAGDQPNNALSLNVLKPGEVAATAGTSGVIYAVNDKLTFDAKSRVNSFAHVNYGGGVASIGVLLCINGTGIFNHWLKDIMGGSNSYEVLNAMAASISPGSDGLYILPFGNGAERMLENKQVGSHIHHIDLNRHTRAHLYRAGQEGIAFAFRYGLDIMRENNIHPTVIRAGSANMFLSPVFRQAFVNATQTPVELYNNDGSVGAALGAGIGAKIYANVGEAFTGMQCVETIEPVNTEVYDALYHEWRDLLLKSLQ